MRIQKFLHSCIRIEHLGKKLLIDPGAFSFNDGTLKPEDIGPVDVILITHKHLDHYFPDALKVLLKLRKATIITNPDVGAELEKEHLPFTTIAAGQIMTVAGFTIRALDAPHGIIPTALPHNTGYLIDEKLLHTGDSFAVQDVPAGTVFALPIAGPWATLQNALDCALRLKPSQVIPIHDAIIKDFMLERIYQMCDAFFAKHNIKFHPLKLGEELER